MVATRTVQVAITAIDSAERVSSRAAALGGVNRIVVTLAVATGLIFYAIPAHATAEYVSGIITKNAFLLSQKANIKRNNRFYYGLVGYLPIGTEVYIENKPLKITNLRKTKDEIYYRVFSSLGTHGLVRKDRFMRTKDKRIAVVASGHEIVLRYPTGKGEIKMGPYEAYLEITG